MVRSLVLQARRPRRAVLFLVSLCFAGPSSIFAADRITPKWSPDGNTFWYQAAPGEFVLIDARDGSRKTAAELGALGLPEPVPVRSSDTTIEPRPSARTGATSGLRFVNELDSEVSLFWIDAGGKRSLYGTIAPGSEREQHTYEGHVWIVSRADGTDLPPSKPARFPPRSSSTARGENRQHRQKPRRTLLPTASLPRAFRKTASFSSLSPGGKKRSSGHRSGRKRPTGAESRGRPTRGLSSSVPPSKCPSVSSRSSTPAAKIP
jgi:hypothetical protein